MFVRVENVLREYCVSSVVEGHLFRMIKVVIARIRHCSFRAEDDVHFGGSDDAVSDRAKGCALVFSIVDTIVSNCHKINIVVFIGLVYQVILNALVDSL